MKPEVLILKWRTVKGWSNLSDGTVQILQRWADLGTCMSAALQRDTPEQKEIICEVIDRVAHNGGLIENDWDGGLMTAEEAKHYVMGEGPDQ